MGASAAKPASRYLCLTLVHESLFPVDLDGCWFVLVLTYWFCQQSTFQTVIALRTKHIWNGVREEQNSGKKFNSFQYRGYALRLYIDSILLK